MSVPLSELETEVGSVEATDEPTAGKIAGRSPWQLAWTRLKRDKVSLTAGVIIGLAIVMAILAPLLEHFGVLDPYSPNTSVLNLNDGNPLGSLGGVSWSHPLGVEPQTGRDVLSRIALGISFSLLIATSATIISVVLGTIAGIVSGYAGGATDYWISRLMDLILSFPQLLMLLALSSVLKSRIAALIGGGTKTDAVYLIVVLGFFGWPYLARIVRGQVLSLRNREFVEAARSLGASRRRIWFKELLPNLWAPIIIYASLTLPLNISAEAALSYLKVGLQAPAPSLGNVLNDSVSFYNVDPFYFFAPGVVLVLIVLAFNMFGDGLRDALDPKSNR